MNDVRPKLAVHDADAAIEFWSTTLDATTVSRYTYGDTVVAAEVEVLGTTIAVKDADESDPVPSPGPILDVVVDDPDAVAARMIDAGATQVFEIADQPYGARGGRVQDPFGVQWLLQTPVTMSPDEVQAAIDAL